MAFDISVYNPATNRIRKTYLVTSAALADAQCEPGERWILGKHDPAQKYIDPTTLRPGRIGDGGTGDPGK